MSVVNDAAKLGVKLSSNFRNLNTLYNLQIIEKDRKDVSNLKINNSKSNKLLWFILPFFRKKN